MHVFTFYLPPPEMKYFLTKRPSCALSVKCVDACFGPAEWTYRYTHRPTAYHCSIYAYAAYRRCYVFGLRISLAPTTLYAPDFTRHVFHEYATAI